MDDFKREQPTCPGGLRCPCGCNGYHKDHVRLRRRARRTLRQQDALMTRDAKSARAENHQHPAGPDSPREGDTTHA